MSTISTNHSLQFNSIFEFQDYCKTNDQLIIPPHHSFSIRNIKIPFLNDFDESSPLQKMVQTIDRFLHPLGKVTEEFNYGGTIEIQSLSNLSFKSTKQCSFKFSRAGIVTNLRDLFYTMVYSSISQLEIAPNQPLIITEINVTLLKTETTLSKFLGKLITSCEAPGSMANLICEGNTSLTQLNEKNVVVLKSSETMTFTILPDYEFETIGGFQEKILLNNKLIIPAGKILKINDKKILQWYRLLKTKFTDAIIFHLLDRLLYSYGKTVDILSQKELNWKLNYEGLQLWSDGELVLTPSRRDIFVNLYDLGLMMDYSDNFELEFQPNQRLVLEIDSSQFEELNEDFQKGSLSTLQGFLFYQIVPYSFYWTLNGQGVDLQTDAHANDLTYSLCFQSSQGFCLALKPASAETFVMNLLKNSNSELVQGISEGDPDAFILLLVKAVGYFSERDPSEELLKMFTESTQNNVIQLLQNSDFNQAHQIALNHPQLTQLMEEIVNLTPDEFSKLDLNSLNHESVKLIVSKIKELAYGELRGSPFLNEAVKKAIDLLNHPKLLKSKIGKKSLAAILDSLDLLNASRRMPLLENERPSAISLRIQNYIAKSLSKDFFFDPLRISNTDQKVPLFTLSRVM